MCTAITYRAEHHYFGRNLDLERSYGEAVMILPRRFPLHFRCMAPLERHYAMIGVAPESEPYPLYYDAVNEAGLAVAALRFSASAVYHRPAATCCCAASFELIPLLLGRCATVAQARPLLKQLRIVDLAYSAALPPTPLHWLLADRDSAVVIEPTADGLMVHDNPVGVLTNEPPFPQQLLRLADHMQLHSGPPQNRLAPTVDLPRCSGGMGAVGLPGDLSSGARFVRAAFGRLQSVCGSGEGAGLCQTLHILQTVAQTRGCCRLEDGSLMFTRYTGVCDTDRGIYYYRTCDNPQLTAVSLHAAALDAAQPEVYPLRHTLQAVRQNY